MINCAQALPRAQKELLRVKSEAEKVLNKTTTAEKPALTKDMGQSCPTSKKAPIPKNANCANCAAERKSETTGINSWLLSSVSKLEKDVQPALSDCTKALSCNLERDLGRNIFSTMLTAFNNEGNACPVLPPGSGLFSAAIVTAFKDLYKSAVEDPLALGKFLVKASSSALVGFFNHTKKIENGTSTVGQMAAHVSPDELKALKEQNAKPFLSRIVSQVIGFFDEAGKNAACQKWKDNKPFGTCEIPLASLRCATCEQKIQYWAGIVGRSGGQVAALAASAAMGNFGIKTAMGAAELIGVNAAAAKALASVAAFEVKASEAEGLAGSSYRLVKAVSVSALNRISGPLTDALARLNGALGKMGEAGEITAERLKAVEIGAVADAASAAPGTLAHSKALLTVAGINTLKASANVAQVTIGTTWKSAHWLMELGTKPGDAAAENFLNWASRGKYSAMQVRLAEEAGLAGKAATKALETKDPEHLVVLKAAEGGKTPAAVSARVNEALDRQIEKGDLAVIEGAPSRSVSSITGEEAIATSQSREVRAVKCDPPGNFIIDTGFAGAH